MAMGGGSGAAAPTMEQKMMAARIMNPSASGGELWDAASSGLTGMQYENYRIGQQMVRGNGKDPGAMADVKRYGLQMRDLAQGGLMARGMGQLNQALNAPDLAPGIQNRMASRFGVQATPEQQAAMNQQAALAQASNRVGLANQTRTGLANAQRDMRFGGINV